MREAALAAPYPPPISICGGASKTPAEEQVIPARDELTPRNDWREVAN